MVITGIITHHFLFLNPSSNASRVASPGRPSLCTAECGELATAYARALRGTHPGEFQKCHEVPWGWLKNVLYIRAQRYNSKMKSRRSRVRARHSVWIEVDSGHAKGVLQISIPCSHLGFDQTLGIFRYV